MSLFTSDRILVAGSGHIAEYLFQRLRAGDRPAKRIADALPSVRALRSAETLILADPLARPRSAGGETGRDLRSAHAETGRRCG